MVNSMHHQAVGDLAPGLRATAHSPDGIIEALESMDGLVVAVQCHP
jgi:putative glutamine amidotransferase